MAARGGLKLRLAAAALAQDGHGMQMTRGPFISICICCLLLITVFNMIIELVSSRHTLSQSASCSS